MSETVTNSVKFSLHLRNATILSLPRGYDVIHITEQPRIRVLSYSELRCYANYSKMCEAISGDSQNWLHRRSLTACASYFDLTSTFI